MERRLINVPQERPMTVPDEIDQLLCSCDRLPLCLAHIPEELRVVIPRESSRRLLILVVRHGFRETAGLLLSLHAGRCEPLPRAPQIIISLTALLWMENVALVLHGREVTKSSGIRRP